MVLAKITDPKTKQEFSYYVEERLKRNLDEKIIPSLHKKDKDRIIVIDGNEGSGKSTFAIQIGKYVDPSLDLSRIAFNAEDFKKAVYNAKKGQCVIYDEAFTGLSSRASLSGINRALISLMMQMRQKNLFVLIVLPTFFLLDKYVALFRTVGLIHVYESRGERGFFRVYTKQARKILYLTGKMTYSYKHKKVFTNFRGRFRGKFVLGDEKVEKAYRKKKMDALKSAEHTPMSAGQVKYKEQRDVLLHLVKRNLNLSYRELSEFLLEYEIEISYRQIRNICDRFGDKEEKVYVKEIKAKQNNPDSKKIDKSERQSNGVNPPDTKTTGKSTEKAE